MNKWFQTLRVISRTVGCVVVLLLMYLTLLPVERRWAGAEILVADWTGVLLLTGAVLLLAVAGKMKITVTDVVVFAWFAVYTVMVWTGDTYSCRSEYLHATVMFLLYFALRQMFVVADMPAWMIIASVIVGGCYEAVMGMEQMVNGTSRHTQYLLTGNFLNPGPYSAYLMMGLAVGLTAMGEAGNKSLAGRVPAFVPRWMATVVEKIRLKDSLLVTVLIMAAVLPATWSRAAYVGIGVVCLWAYRKWYWNYRYLVWGLLVVAGVAFYLVKQGSANGRIIIWVAGLATWLDSPWTGVGVGGFCHAVARGMELLHDGDVWLSSAGVTDNAYNILLKTLVEQGVAGAAFAVALCVAAMGSLRRSCRPLFYGMVALLTFSMFSYPFDLLPYKIIAVMTVAWGETVGGKVLTGMKRKMTVAMAVVLAFAGRQTYGLIKESDEADREYDVYRGLKSEAFIEDYYGLLPLEGDNAEFLFEFGQMLREAGRYSDSNDILRRGMLCSADPMFYVLTGNNYKDMSRTFLAEHFYERAFAVMPNRIYPLYQLMKLYEENGRLTEAKETARRIYVMRPKVESKATKEMQEEAETVFKEIIGKEISDKDEKEMEDILNGFYEQLPVHRR